MHPPPGHIPFTPRAKKVLELSLRESLQLGHNYIGTEHILLGLVREGDGVAAQVLVKLGADLNRVRHQVIQLIAGRPLREVRREKESAVDAQDYEQAEAQRNRETELLAAKASRQEQWVAGHSALPLLAERVQELADEIERLRTLLREHGIDPHDKTA